MNFFNNKFCCHFVDETTSTNILLNEIVVAQQNSKTELPDFYCVATDFQIAGKGQGAKTWLSNKGENILASFYFQPHILPNQQIYFNYFFALTIKSTLLNYVDNVFIKKPNDIYVNDKKVAGILIEHRIQGEKLTYSVGGVGINVNQTEFDSSLPNPTSLKLLTNKNLSREKILEELVENGKYYYEKLQIGAFNELENEYESYVKIY